MPKLIRSGNSIISIRIGNYFFRLVWILDRITVSTFATVHLGDWLQSLH